MIKRVVAYTCENLEHALVVLRLSGPAHMAGFEFLRGNDSGDDLQVISSADVVVIQRNYPFLTDAYERVVAEARRIGKPVVYEIDDLLWELPVDHPDRQSHYYTRALWPMLLAAMEADAVTVSTPNLYGYIRSINPNVWLLPNYLNDRIWSLRSPKCPEQNGRPVVLGYIGGKNTHEHDVRMILPVLQHLLQHYGERIELRFWGTQPPKELLLERRVEYIPLAIANYAEYAAYCFRQECDIMLGPLQSNSFNSCKSPIKFLEYAALGLPGVYSRIDPYEDLVRHGWSGFLASTLDEWYDSLVRLVENPALRFEMSLNAQDYVQRNWLLSKQASRWTEAYTEIVRSTKRRNPYKTAGYMNLIAAIARESMEWDRAAVKEMEDQARQIHVLQAQLAEYQAAFPPANGRLLLDLVRRLSSFELWLFPPHSFRRRIAKAVLRAVGAVRQRILFQRNRRGNCEG